MTEAVWAIGQRVRSESEPFLGLGIVDSFPTSRSIGIHFPAASEHRIYNPTSAPIRRYELGVGQTAVTREGRSVRIEQVKRDGDDLLIYCGQGHEVPEAQLADSSPARDPLEHLSASELSHPSAFNLRAASWKLRSEVLRHPCRGLMGGRVLLLPHQLAIAHRITHRERPRALLADEVGLGKTIEACLVFSALRALERADRVLVLTPASLVHQWLIELYRRFNELFTVVHSEVIPDGDAAPFPDTSWAEASRLIAPLDWLAVPGRLELLLAEPWDLVIVDEAHHLRWSPHHASPEYQAVEALASQCEGLLLLTATPLREGPETEFGLLRLVDPERFADLSRFKSEQAHMREVADLARRLEHGEPVHDELRRLYPGEPWVGTAAEILPHLIDRHGTGRILVRNRREKLGGFPGRRLHLTRLPLPDSWKKVQAWPEIRGLQRLLGRAIAPGQEPPTSRDPRVEWVIDKIRSLGDQKVLLMASTVSEVRRLEKLVRHRTGRRVAMFHEELGLVERDRQAAYFADPEGAQILVSSEIGGEGRNFQFCHHLLLFDLPLHPDALEQRIGRLDRIGQTRSIKVHVVVVEQTPAEALFEWHRRLHVFESPLTGGEHMMEAQASRLLDVLKAHTPEKRGRAELEAFLRETDDLLARHRAEVQAGVDFLIDLNSFDRRLGEALVEEAKAFDQDLLQETVSDLLEHFGVVEEDLADPAMLRIRPGDHMKVESFPGLRADGNLATYDRDRALSREEVQFLSPDHPLVEGALALLLDQPEGRASVALWPSAPEPGIWVEFLFVLEAVGPGRLWLPRFLPPSSISVTLDLNGEPQDLVPLPKARLRPVSHRLWTQLAGPIEVRLPELLEKGEAIADSLLGPQAEAAVARARALLGDEQQRLEELHRLGNVSSAEISSHSRKVEDTIRSLAEAQVRLDAVRIVVAIDGDACAGDRSIGYAPDILALAPNR